MSNSVYHINKGINRPIEFKGLKAQYIWYLGGGIMALVILFAIMYITGVNTFICLGIILVLGIVLFIVIYKMSDRYGEHGIMKFIAGRSVPDAVKVYSRNVFTQLIKSAGTIK